MKCWQIVTKISIKKFTYSLGIGWSRLIGFSPSAFYPSVVLCEIWERKIMLIYYGSLCLGDFKDSSWVCGDQFFFSKISNMSSLFDHWWVSEGMLADLSSAMIRFVQMKKMICEQSHGMLDLLEMNRHYFIEGNIPQQSNFSGTVWRQINDLEFT